MSILQAMYTGVSGIQAEGEALGVVGDNISNTNTIGFKGQRSVFEDMLGHSISAGSATALPGSGVKMAGVQQLFTQGSLSNTGVSTWMPGRSRWQGVVTSLSASLSRNSWNFSSS